MAFGILGEIEWSHRLNILNDWLDVDVSFRFVSWQQFNFPVVAFMLLRKLSSTQFSSGKYKKKKQIKNERKINNFVRNVFCARCKLCTLDFFSSSSFALCRMSERLCVCIYSKIWFSCTSISEIIYCLRYTVWLSWRLKTSCVWCVLCAPYVWT